MSKSKPKPETRLRLKAKIKDTLIATAKLGQTVSYSDLVQIINWPGLTYRSHSLYEILDSISEDEATAGRGFLSAVVIRKDRDKSKPNGLIELASRLGQDTTDQVKFWNEEIARVCYYWQTH